jgi:hypothetical protein
MTLIDETAPARRETRECAYNLFRNKERAELYCAVPEDRPIPSLIGAEAWTFERILRIHDIAPPGFSERGREGWRALQRLLPFSSHGSNTPDQQFSV